MKGSSIMYFFLAIVAVAMVKNAAGTTGIILGLGSVGNQFTSTMVGNPSATKGTFTSGSTKISLG